MARLPVPTGWSWHQSSRCTAENHRDPRVAQPGLGAPLGSLPPLLTGRFSAARVNVGVNVGVNVAETVFKKRVRLCENQAPFQATRNLRGT